MKRKKWIKWAALLVLGLTVVAHCFTWPGREISKDAGVEKGAWVLETEDARRIVTILRRPHIATVSDDKLDCVPEMKFTVINDETQYLLYIHAHTRKGCMVINEKEWGWFYIPPWEMKTLEGVFS